MQFLLRWPVSGAISGGFAPRVGDSGRYNIMYCKTNKLLLLMIINSLCQQWTILDGAERGNGVRGSFDGDLHR
jgi:hypothetical protein